MAARKHDTEAMRKHTVDASVWWEFHPGQRVRTREGFLGIVVAVEDGPHAGAEHYVVELDGGAGGGEYSSSELTAAGVTASKQSVETHLASDDYPMLADILVERPPIENEGKAASYSIPENDFSTSEQEDLDQRWEDEDYPDKPYEGSLQTQAFVGDWLNPRLPEVVRDRPGGQPSYDWCRFRRQQHCFFPTHLDERATKIEGRPIWIPKDRGICPRNKWQEQRECPVSEPGPRSREPVYYSDATVPYSAGGQRDVSAFHGEYIAPLTNFNLLKNITVSSSKANDEFTMHYTAAWTDVMNKARYLRQAGNVNITSAPERGTSNEDYIVGEVLGDTGVYRVRLMREPGRRRIAMWECGCAWGHYTWGRSGRWKKFEGRMCSHALAMLYEVQAREGFGGDRQISEDTTVPFWRDADEVPQDRYPAPPIREDWRIASLEMPDGTDLDAPSWRAAAWDADFEDAPIMTVGSAEFTKEGRRAGFPVKWEGQTRWVVQMDTETDAVILDNGVETSAYTLMHPRYHPTLGLSLADSGSYEPMHRGASRISVFKDEPEPALPYTEGEEDDDDFDPDDLYDYQVEEKPDEEPDDDFIFEAAQPVPMETLDTPGDTEPEPQPEPEEDEEPMAAEASLPRPEWIMNGGGKGNDSGISNAEIAAQARKVLAAKTFTAEEQAELIGEGEGVTSARNLDLLDIAGTHYEALEKIDEGEDEYGDLWGLLL